LFPLIKLAKKLKAATAQNQATKLFRMFPLIKLAKKLKAVPTPYRNALLSKRKITFPLIKLAKKLKATLWLPYTFKEKFPLIKLAKKLKVP